MLKKKNKLLESENDELLVKLNKSCDHSQCMLEYDNLKAQLDRTKKELELITSKYTIGNEKFEKMLNMQRYTLSRCGLG
ncbi:hypothetical protein J0J37_22550, partial [Vibrio vulnificus]|uniref:hypothetical protein n=1 Tax=Vibrio vulnificus TaxID=672 RepID=UPI0019D4EC0C